MSRPWFSTRLHIHHYLGSFDECNTWTPSLTHWSRISKGRTQTSEFLRNCPAIVKCIQSYSEELTIPSAMDEHRAWTIPLAMIIGSELGFIHMPVHTAWISRLVLGTVGLRCSVSYRTWRRHSPRTACSDLGILRAYLITKGQINQNHRR